MKNPCGDCTKHRSHVRKCSVRNDGQAKNDPECLECIKTGKVSRYLEALKEDPMRKLCPSDHCSTRSTHGVKGFGQIEMI